MCRKMSKTPHMSLLDVFFQALNVPKFVFGQGLRFGPDGGAYAYVCSHDRMRAAASNCSESRVMTAAAAASLIFNSTT